MMICDTRLCFGSHTLGGAHRVVAQHDGLHRLRGCEGPVFEAQQRAAVGARALAEDDERRVHRPRARAPDAVLHTLRGARPAHRGPVHGRPVPHLQQAAEHGQPAHIRPGHGREKAGTFAHQQRGENDTSQQGDKGQPWRRQRGRQTRRRGCSQRTPPSWWHTRGARAPRRAGAAGIPAGAATAARSESWRVTQTDTPPPKTAGCPGRRSLWLSRCTAACTRRSQPCSRRGEELQTAEAEQAKQPRSVSEQESYHPKTVAPF